MAQIKLPYGRWRDGRPRFSPGPRERALGYVSHDLKHADGRWFTLDETKAWCEATRAAIAAARGSGRRPALPRPSLTVERLWEDFTLSATFRGAPTVKGLAPSTQASYRSAVRRLAALEPLVWASPAAALRREHVTQETTGLYARLTAACGLGMANLGLAALASAYSWKLRQGGLKRVSGEPMTHPLHELALIKPEPRVRVATDAEIRALTAAADATAIGGTPLTAVGDAILLGLFSGQRQADVLALVDKGVAENRVRLVQGKTRASVSIPMAPRLLTRLAEARERRKRLGNSVVAATAIADEVNGGAYTGNTFRRHFTRVREAAIKGSADPLRPIAACPSLATFKFADLRDTAVTWYARAGATVPEIASITGHSLKSIYTILKHYLLLDETLANSAVAKLIEHMEREGLAV